MVHCDSYHSSYTVTVEALYSVELEAGKVPGITSLEEDADGGGDIKAAVDVEGYLVVPEKFFAWGIEILGSCINPFIDVGVI